MNRIKQLTILLGDLLLFYISLYFAISLRLLNFKTLNTFLSLVSAMSLLFIVGLVIFFIIGLYDLSQSKNNWQFYKKIVISHFIWLLLGIIFFYIRPQKDVSPKTILFFVTVLNIGFISLWRFLYNKFLSTSILENKVIFLGLTPESLEIAELINKEPQRGFEIIGIVEPENPQFANQTLDEHFNTNLKLTIQTDLNKLLKENNGKTSNLIIVMSPHLTSNNQILKDLYKKLFLDISIIDLSEFYEEITGRIPPFTFSEGWFLSNFKEQNKKIYDRFKLIVDYFFAILIGSIFIITLPLVSLAIKLSSNGSVFFTQIRSGKQDQTFKIYKYRTMKVLASDGSAELSGPEFAKDHDVRITFVGNFLRKTRLDEIPQFINILKGEMSLIGPRPERPEVIKNLTEEMPFYKLRHLVKPGLSGWAQVQQGYTSAKDENLRKLEYDLYYIKNRGPLLDLNISLKTLNTIAKFGGK